MARMKGFYQSLFQKNPEKAERSRRGRPRKTGEKTSAEQWLEKIDRAKDVKRDWEERFRVNTSVDFWEGRQRPPAMADEEWITVNLIFSNLEAILPSLYSQDPYFYVRVKRSFDPHPMQIALMEKRGETRQSFLNYLKGELKLKDKARLAIFDSMFAFGTLKASITSQVRENPFAGQQILGEDGTPLVGTDGEELVEPDSIPAGEQYQWSRIHPADFLVDEDAGPIEPDNVSWKAHQLKQTVDDVRRNPAYKSGVRNEVQPTALSDVERKRQERKKGPRVTSADSGKRQEEKPDTVLLWEVWDLDRREWFVLAEGHNSDFLRDPEPFPKGIEDDPFVSLRFSPRNDSWYPNPPVSQWLDPQRDINDLLSRQKTHRKRFDRKYLAYKQAFDNVEDAVDRFLDQGDGAVIIADTNPGWAPISPIQDAPLDGTNQIELGNLMAAMNDIAVGANQRGAGRGVDSATEAGIVESRTQLREGDRLSSVSDFLADSGRKMDGLVQANITQEQAVRVTGPEGDKWILVRTEDYEEISGEYEYTVQAGSTRPQLPDIERAQWTAFLAFLANAPQFLLSKRLLTKTAEMFHVHDEAMIEEIHEIGRQMMGGQIPTPGQQGSTPGAPDEGTRGASAAGGSAAGIANFRGGQ
jgi:hypothetical protein